MENQQKRPVGAHYLMMQGTPMPTLAVRLHLAGEEEEDFIGAAQKLLTGDDDAQKWLAIYHHTTALRVRGASRHLENLRNLRIPSGMILSNGISNESRSKTDETKYDDLEMAIFGFVMNARGALDILAQEINLIFRHTSASPHKGTYDYRNCTSPPNQGGEADVSLQSVWKNLKPVYRKDRLVRFLNKEMGCAQKGSWYHYLTHLRHVNYHRRIVLRTEVMRSPLSLEEMPALPSYEVEMEIVKMWLPDDPKLFAATFDKKLELIQTFSEIESWLCKFVKEVYKRLSERIQRSHPNQCESSDSKGDEWP